MSTIHVVYGYKQYSEAALIVAAYDTAEEARDFMALIDALEPRYTLKVQQCELRTSGLPVIGRANVGPAFMPSPYRVTDGEGLVTTVQVDVTPPDVSNSA